MPYGGFMMLIAIGKTPDICAAAVEDLGVFNWTTMLRSSILSLSEYLKTLLGNPDESPKICRADSPIIARSPCCSPKYDTANRGRFISEEPHLGANLAQSSDSFVGDKSPRHELATLKELDEE
jgi:Prolyl oligopeptidase family